MVMRRTQCRAENREMAIVAAGGSEARSRRDLDLLEGVRAGDRTAFEELYRLYHPRLTRFLMNLVHRPALVEEVLDDTMMVVWERPHSFHSASKFSTWLFAIAYRKIMRGLRRQDQAVEDKAQDQRVSEALSPEDEVGQQRLSRLLMEAMEQLSPAHRAVVDLTYFHDMGYQEIAQVLECPVDTVKTRMFYARRHLKRHLAGNFTDWI
jgi:RNA polymerase sigma-70 factor (ECF subfamily)